MASALLFPLLRDTAKPETPQILRIDRYSLPPGTEAAMRNLQKQVALAMTRWDNPHPCMAIESLTGNKEVWCLSGFQSRAEQVRVAENLEKNDVLRESLGRIESQIQVLCGNPVSVMANYCPGSRCGRPWVMGRGHYLVISVTDGPVDTEGSAFDTGEGIRYRITAARTRRDADLRAAAAGSEAQVFAVRPAWGAPSRVWISRDPDFWGSSPVAKRGPVRTSQFRLR